MVEQQIYRIAYRKMVARMNEGTTYEDKSIEFTRGENMEREEFLGLIKKLFKYTEGNLQNVGSILVTNHGFRYAIDTTICVQVDLKGNTDIR